MVYWKKMSLNYIYCTFEDILEEENFLSSKALINTIYSHEILIFNFNDFGTRQFKINIFRKMIKQKCFPWLIFQLILNELSFN